MLKRFITLLLLWLVTAPAGAVDSRFLAFGDSVTVGHGDGFVCAQNQTGGYPPRLRSSLLSRGLEVEIANFGLCGELTVSGVTRIDSVLAAGGDVIVIMEGTNDVSAFVSAETILFNLEVMATKAESRGIEPLMASFVPRGPGSGTDSDNTKTAFLAHQLGLDSAAKGRVFADPFASLIDLPNFFERFYHDPWHPNSAGYDIFTGAMVGPAEEAAERRNLCSEVPPGPCVASANVLCLNNRRFRVEAFWENFFGEGGLGNAVPQTDDTGAFFWVDSQNIELVVKVLDGLGYNGHHWVFYGALSNLEFSLLVTDTQTGRCREYFNPLGNFASVGDTVAFPE